MAAADTIAYGVTMAVVAVSVLNEATSCLNPWIILPIYQTNGKAAVIYPIIWILVYAVFEPLVTIFFAQLPVHPWIMLYALSVSLHIVPSFHITEILRCSSITIEHHSQNREAFETEKRPQTTSNSTNRGRYYWMLILPAITSAAINIALLRLAQFLVLSHNREEKHLMHFWIPFTFIVFLACRFVDYQLFKRLKTWRYRERDPVCTQLSRLSGDIDYSQSVRPDHCRPPAVHGFSNSRCFDDRRRISSERSFLSTYTLYTKFFTLDCLASSFFVLHSRGHWRASVQSCIP